MIGSFIVYEGTFHDRFSVRQVMGETKSFWNVRNTKSLDIRKIKKGSIGPCAFFAVEVDAQKAARRYTDKMIKARKHFLDRRAELLVELQQSATSEIKDEGE